MSKRTSRSSDDPRIVEIHEVNLIIDSALDSDDIREIIDNAFEQRRIVPIITSVKPIKTRLYAVDGIHKDDGPAFQTLCSSLGVICRFQREFHVQQGQEIGINWLLFELKIPEDRIEEILAGIKEFDSKLLIWPIDSDKS